MRFLNDDDYGILVRQEIKSLLTDDDDTKLLRAENTAISQMKQSLSDYDTDKIFDPNGDRDEFIIMTIIDIVLYHLYSKESPQKMSETRSNRYDDAVKWLRSVSKGQANANLPVKDDYVSDVRIISRKPSNHKY